FGSAPFEAHPHHMKAMREGLLVIFASALLKKMMGAWMRKARAMREMLQQAKLKAKQRSLGAWKEGAAKCRRLRSKSLQVSNRRQSQVQVRALQHWQHRWSARTQHRRQLRDFDVTCWHRCCRRAMTAWHVVRRQEETARAAQLRKVFACWRLAAREQQLLEKYLHECAAINIQGKSTKSTVEASDLEQLYREMAEYRWNVDLWDLSD
ncbi:unnamed protein product, partial [Effrenium voratum]